LGWSQRSNCDAQRELASRRQRPGYPQNTPLLAAPEFQHFRFVHVLYAILSLTVVRMIPVAVAMIGTRLSAASVLFIGWFGPRGLASIVLGLVFLEEETHLSGGRNDQTSCHGYGYAQHFCAWLHCFARHSPVC